MPVGYSTSMPADTPSTEESAKEYLDGIDVSKVTSGLWDPTKQWNRLHGDGKSTTGGAYHIETILGSDGVFKAKVVGPGGSAKVEASWPAGTNPKPSVAAVIAALKAKA
ncbi:hypothetical protein LXA43DRAFT_1057876 [Ganoderma leucocontextum]|nr:hypothetical protein LXA43DRAFT_1057876 [Ganoderma leucocontextum]